MDARDWYDRPASRRDLAIGSRAQKASEWNVYVISVAYYPAQIAEPTPEHRKAIRGAARVMVGVGRIVLLEFLHATGILAGARGYPRCADAAISAAGIFAEMGGGAWGPPCLSPHVQRRIDGLRAWAAVPGDGHLEWPERARGDQRCKERIGDLLARWAAGDLSRRELARSGGDIYAALWRTGLGGGGGSQETVAAMVGRAKARGWFPAAGDEWGFARYVTGFNAVFHVGKTARGTSGLASPGGVTPVAVGTLLGPGSREAPATRGWRGARSAWMASGISRRGLGSWVMPTLGTAS